MSATNGIGNLRRPARRQDGAGTSSLMRVSSAWGVEGGHEHVVGDQPGARSWPPADGGGGRRQQRYGASRSRDDGQGRDVGHLGGTEHGERLHRRGVSENRVRYAPAQCHLSRGHRGLRSSRRRRCLLARAHRVDVRHLGETWTAAVREEPRGRDRAADRPHGRPRRDPLTTGPYSAFGAPPDLPTASIASRIAPELPLGTGPPNTGASRTAVGGVRCRSGSLPPSLVNVAGADLVRSDGAAGCEARRRGSRHGPPVRQRVP